MWALHSRLATLNCACSCQTSDRSCDSQREILSSFVNVCASLGALVPVLVPCHGAAELSAGLGASGGCWRFGSPVAAGCGCGQAVLGRAGAARLGTAQRFASGFRQRANPSCSCSSCCAGRLCFGCGARANSACRARARPRARGGADRATGSGSGFVAQSACHCKRSAHASAQCLCTTRAQRGSIAQFCLRGGALGGHASVHVARAAREQVRGGPRS